MIVFGRQGSLAHASSKPYPFGTAAVLVASRPAYQAFDAHLVVYDSSRFGLERLA